MSYRSGPRNFDNKGTCVGDVLFSRIIFSGSELLVNMSGPPVPGPHHRLCDPSVTRELPKFSPIYASTTRNRFSAGNALFNCGVPGPVPRFATASAAVICAFTRGEN